MRTGTRLLLAVLLTIAHGSAVSAQSASEPTLKRVFVEGAWLLTWQLDEADPCPGFSGSSCGSPSSSDSGWVLAVGANITPIFGVALETSANVPVETSQNFRTQIQDFYHAETEQRDLAITVTGRVKLGIGQFWPVVVGGGGVMSRHTVRTGSQFINAPRSVVERNEEVWENVPVFVIGADVPLYRNSWFTAGFPVRFYFAGSGPSSLAPLFCTVSCPPVTSDLGTVLLRFGAYAEVRFW